MTAIDFFQGQFAFPIASDMVKAAVLLAGLEVQDDTPIADLGDDEKELTRAFLLRMVAMTQNGYTERTSSSDFGATNAVNSISATQIRAMLSEANRIFKKRGMIEYVTWKNAINIYDDEG